mmetsp:Transcript_52068/g.123972  ORF Transcript_52068/g.123972 Transcript_52068/m.123972 type:complete len:332 (+) Transcript_52068:82-1077(+)
MYSGLGASAPTMAAEAYAWAANYVPPAEEELFAKKTLLHTRQLLSRHEAHLGMQSRLISVLARQLERHRDLLPCWVEQHKAVGMVAWRKEQELAHAGKEVKDLSEQMQRQQAEAKRKHEWLVAGLQQELARADADVQAKQDALKASLEREQQAKLVLNAEEKKNTALKSSLDRTLAQLNAVRSEMLAFKAAQAEKQPGHKEEQQLQALPVEQREELSKEVQEVSKQREVLTKERAQVRLQIEQVQQEIEEHRRRALRLEEFVEKIAGASSTSPSPGGGGAAPYFLERSARKEAFALLTAAASNKRSLPQGGRSASRSRPQSAPPTSRRPQR